MKDLDIINLVSSGFFAVLLVVGNVHARYFVDPAYESSIQSMEPVVGEVWPVHWDLDLYGEVLVWSNSPSGNFDIYGKNLLTGEEFVICNNPANQEDPAIYDDIVVWHDLRNDIYDEDIYGKNLSTSEELVICTNPAGQVWPDICGDIVVWMDTRNSPWYDIYGKDLSTGQEFPVCTNPGNEFLIGIYGDIVIYQHEGGYYGKDLSTEEEFFIGTSFSDEWLHFMYGNIYVYQGGYGGSLYGRDLSTGEEFIICDNSVYYHQSVINGDRVAWINIDYDLSQYPPDIIWVGDIASNVILSPTINKSGSAITEFLEGKDDYSISNSAFPPYGCLLDGGLIASCKALYSFFLPDSSNISCLRVGVYGKGTFDTDIIIGEDTQILDNVEGWNDFNYPDISSLPNIVDAGDGIGSRLDIIIDATNHNYDVKEIQVTYDCNNIEKLEYLNRFQVAYSGYRAIRNFKTDIVEDTWGLSGTVSEEIINKAVQRTGAFCQNLLGLDGNIFQAVKSFSASLEAFQNLVNLIYDYADFIAFWGSWPQEYPYDYPSLKKIKDDCEYAATACAGLAMAYQDLAFDGIDGNEGEQILGAINNAKVELEALKSTLQWAAYTMDTKYHNGGLGSQSAKLSKQSMSPMMRYEEEDLTLLDSYLPNFINDIEAQAEQFVTVDFDITPSDKALYFTVDGSNYTAAQTFVWLKGSPYIIEALPTQTGNDGYIYEFNSWSDGGDPTHDITPTSDDAYTVTYTVDKQTPTPDPMSWEDEPYAISFTAITMAATSASDPEGNGVRYYFEETSGNPGGNDSGWQDSSAYTDYDLLPNTTYAYTVKARDKSLNAELNVTAPSSPPASAKTYQIGDFDHSRINDWTDLGMFIDYWLYSCSGPSWCDERDINHSGGVSLPDFAEFARRWLEDNSP